MNHAVGSRRRSRAVVQLWLAAIVSTTVLGQGRALAVPDDQWDARFFANGTNVGGYVSAIVVGGGNVYVGGSFTSIFGVPANNVARWDGSAWSALGTGTNTQVNALAVSGSDLYAGGSFTMAGGGAASRVAKWNGTSWSALGSGIDSEVRALAVLGSTVYAGGFFNNAGGSGASRVAQWNGTTWSPLGTGMNGDVYSLAVSGSTLYAGGDFTTADGGAATRVAQWNGTSWSALGTGTNNRVTALTTSGTDLYAGGFFTSAGGAGANAVARWDGATWSALGTGLTQSGGAAALALAVVGSDLYAEGGFTLAGGSPANYVAKWNGSSWSALGTGLGLTNAFGSGGALASSGTDVYVGGQFIRAGGTSTVSIARWDGSGSTWSVATTTPGLGAASSAFYPGVRALARSSSGDIYAGGVFEFAGDAPAISVAKFDGSSWSALGTGLEGTNFANYGHGFAQALAFYNGDLYVGGNFATAGGVTVNHIARWNGTSFAALGSGVGGGQVIVNALIEYSGEVYVGGSFSTVNGSPMVGIARWNGTSWSAVGTGTSGTVYAFAILGSDLYVGGEFTTGGGGPGNYVARWNGTTWSAVGSGPGSAPSALAAVGSDLYATGAFPNGSGIVKWDGATWSIPGGGICWFCGFGGHYGVGLASVGNDLYVSGYFDNVGSPSVSASGIAKWNGVSWSALGSGLGGCVGSSCGFPGAGPLLISGTDVWAGGRFSSAGNKPAAFISVWHNCGNGAVDPNEQCDDGNLANGDCCSSTCQYETSGGACPDDGNPCTNDQCNGSGGCTHPNNTASCDDSLFCNGIDVCSGGTCGHAGDPCPGPDGDIDCTESCDEAADACTGADPNGSACDDGDGCTLADTCGGGICQPGAPKNCADPNVCTDDSCSSPSGTCVHTPNTVSCDDGLFCNGADVCSGGTCTHGTDPCAGGPECAQTCNEAADNCFAPASTSCTADTNVCTDDHCNGAGTCVHTANTAPCDDALFCNGADVCAASGCTHAGDPCAGGSACNDACNETSDTCVVPDSTPCTDGNACTTGETCTAGVCGGGTTTVCPLCEACDTVGGCYEGPRTGCKHPTQPLKASILLKDGTPDDLDQAKWKWSNGQATTFAELGAPLTTDDYALCIYDSTSSLLFRMLAPAGGTCGTKPCWKQLGPPTLGKGYKYKDNDGLPHDLDSMTMKAGLDGKAKITLKGKGGNIPMPGLGALALPLTTQLQSENGQCYEATTVAPSVNTTTLFKAKAD